MKNNPTIAAFTATILFGGTLGVLITVAAFGFLRIGEQAVEALGYLPLRWGENNIDILFILSLVISVPMTLSFVMWFYKRSRTSEISLAGYKYVPPSK